LAVPSASGCRVGKMARWNFGRKGRGAEIIGG
jgi:hypothetical protein